MQSTSGRRAKSARDHTGTTVTVPLFASILSCFQGGRLAGLTEAAEYADPEAGRARGKAGRDLAAADRLA